MKLGELVKVLGGKVVQGSPQWEVDGVSSTALACSSDVIFAEDAGSVAKALASHAGVVVVKQAAEKLDSEGGGGFNPRTMTAESTGALAPEGKIPSISSETPSFSAASKAGLSEEYSPANCIVEAEQPRLWFALAAKLLKPALLSSEVHPTAVVGEGVELGEGVSIGACAVVEEHAHIGAGTRIEAGVVIGRGVHIGENCHIYPRAVIYPGTGLGNWVTVHAGAVLGADGFGYVRDTTTGAYTQFPQQGTLLIEDDVEIGANSTIDRGALKQTRIGRGTKIDNLVHVGHNCDIGEDVILVALTGISGSSSVGNGAVIAGQVGIGDHAHIGPGVILGGQAGVLSGKTVTNQGLKPGTVLWGTPARPLKQVLRELAVLARLAKGSRKARDKEQGQGTRD